MPHRIAHIHAPASLVMGVYRIQFKPSDRGAGDHPPHAAHVDRYYKQIIIYVKIKVHNTSAITSISLFFTTEYFSLLAQ